MFEFMRMATGNNFKFQKKSFFYYIEKKKILVALINMNVYNTSFGFLGLLDPN